MTHPSTRPKHFKAVGLVSTGHFLSHFYMLLIPPLFPLLKDEFGIGFTELGITITVFSVVTGLTQAPVGFLVDRFGARKILLCGLLLESAAFIWIGLSPSYWMLLAMMGVAGLANAVYHPANYAILNASVQSGRMGQAFSIHTAAGMLGNAVAPVTMVLLLSVTDWKTGLIVCGVTGGLASVLIAAFGVATLTIIHEITVTEAATILSAYLFASPIGVLCGGWIADRIRHHHLFAGVCFVAIALAFFIMAGLSMRLEVIAFVFVIAGFFSGVVSPSRDMLIRSLAPPTEMGKVFGFVSTGFNVAGIIAPPLFGYILDHHNPSAVFWTVGAVSLLTVLTVVTTGQKRERNLA